MGWGLRKSPERDGLFAAHYVGKAAAVGYDAVVVDMCSEARRIGSGSRPESADRFAERLCRGLFKRTSGLVVALFDCKERMHKERGVLHARRYRHLDAAQAAAARAAGKVVVGGVAYARGCEPYTRAEVDDLTASDAVVWSRLWSSSHGKEHAWSLLYAGMIRAHHSAASDDRTFVMWLRGTPHVWPYTGPTNVSLRRLADAMCANTHGEGDQRVCAAAEVLVSHGVGDVLVQTVDTDMLLQVLCTCGWAPRGDRREPAARVHLQLKNEVVDVVSVRGCFGAGDAARMSAAFWGLACGGVDYCRGLTRFGFKTTDLLALMKDAGAPVVGTCDGGSTVTLDTPAVMAALHRLPRRNVKAARVADFVAEVNAMLFCVVLFAGACSKREPCGGPDMPCLDFFPDNTAVVFDGAFVAWAARANVLHAAHADS